MRAAAAAAAAAAVNSGGSSSNQPYLLHLDVQSETSGHIGQALHACTDVVAHGVQKHTLRDPVGHIQRDKRN